MTSDLRESQANPIESSETSPLDWIRTSLSDACHLITDGTHFSPPNSLSGDFKYVTAKNIKAWGLDLSNITYVSKDIHEEIYSRCPVEKGDVLYIKDGATTGLAAINHLDEEFSLLSSVALFKPVKEVLNERYLKNWLNSPDTYSSLTADMTGTAIKRLVLKQLRAVEIPLPPLAEQIRIADKLDALLARVEAGRERLGRVPKLLKRFRQSVLSAAVSGELTREWRGGGDAEWEETTLGAVAYWTSGGTPSRSNPAYFGGDIPWVKTGELRESVITSAEETLTQLGLQNSSAKIFPAGTILIAIYGATIGRVGILAIDAATNQACAAAQPNTEKIDRQYMYYLLRAEKETLITKGQGGAQPNISQGILKAHEIDLPSLAEQSEIVRRIESLFAIADRIEAKYAAALSSFDRLTPALLAKAFRGELVPQDPNDEPASVLLERIRAAREAEGTGTKRGRKPKAAGASSDGAVPKAAADSREPKRRGRPRKVQPEADAMPETEAISAAADAPPRGRGRPIGDGIPQASSFEDALKKLEEQKLQRAQGARQVGLFEE